MSVGLGIRCGAWSRGSRRCAPACVGGRWCGVGDCIDAREDKDAGGEEKKEDAEKFQHVAVCIGEPGNGEVVAGPSEEERAGSYDRADYDGAQEH